MEGEMMEMEMMLDDNEFLLESVQLLDSIIHMNCNRQENVESTDVDDKSSEKVTRDGSQMIEDDGFDEEDNIPLAAMRVAYHDFDCEPSGFYDDNTTNLPGECVPGLQDEVHESTGSSDHAVGAGDSSSGTPLTPSTSFSSEAGLSTVSSPTDFADEDTTTKRGRTRVRKNEAEWKNNIRKRQRDNGEEYVTKRGVLKRARILKPGCGASCRNRCHTKVNQEQREIIFSNYWKVGSLTRQRDFLNSNVQLRETKVSTTKHQSRREKTRHYFLPLENDKIRVCKQFFLDTFGVSEQSVRTAIAKGNECGLSREEERGRHNNRGNAIDTEKEKMREHVKSFPKVESHYCRKDTGKEYLGANLNLQKMYDLYVENRDQSGQCDKPGSLSTYKKIFYEEFNLAFHQRSKDKCDFCSSYDNSDPNSRCEADYLTHLQLKDSCREYKNEMKNQVKDSMTSTAAVFDLQEVLPTPKSNESCMYYKRQLNTYNFTIYEYGTGQGFNFIWNETMAGRGSNEIGSCLYKYLLECSKQGKKKIHLFSDSCGGQNRNKNILSLLWFCLNKLEFDEIEHIFFVSGHSFNEGDSMHSCIERAARHISVFTTPQWAQVIRTAKRSAPRFIVQEMDCQDFISVKSVAEKLKNFELSTDREKIAWLKVKKFRLLRDEPNLVRVYYDYSDNFTTLNLAQKIRVVHEVPNVENIELQPVNFNTIPISAEKHKDLVDLCEKNIIPQVYHSYYRSLQHE